MSLSSYPPTVLAMRFGALNLGLCYRLDRARTLSANILTAGAEDTHSDSSMPQNGAKGETRTLRTLVLNERCLPDCITFAFGTGDRN